MASQQQLRADINTRLIQALESNLVPWRRPWSSNHGGRHRNFQTNRPYSGVNPLLLEIHNQAHGFSSNRWLTFNQVKALGCRLKPRPAHVPQGRWGCGIIYYRLVEKKTLDPKTGVERIDTVPLMRLYWVFNQEQVVGKRVEVPAEEPTLPPGPDAEFPAAEELIAATQADLRYSDGDRAYYVRPTPFDAWPNHTDGDNIVLPRRNRFASNAAFVETTLHELAHWSEVRLGWDHRKHGYEMGELVAELSSVYLASELGVPMDNLPNHASYLKSWLAAMKADTSFIFKASSQASKVTDFLLSFVRKVEAEDSEAVEAVGA